MAPLTVLEPAGARGDLLRAEVANFGDLTVEVQQTCFFSHCDRWCALHTALLQRLEPSTARSLRVLRHGFIEASKVRDSPHPHTRHTHAVTYGWACMLIVPREHTHAHSCSSPEPALPCSITSSSSSSALELICCASSSLAGMSVQWLGRVVHLSYSPASSSSPALRVVLSYSAASSSASPAYSSPSSSPSKDKGLSATPRCRFKNVLARGEHLSLNVLCVSVCGWLLARTR